MKDFVDRPKRRGFLTLLGTAVLLPSFAATACTADPEAARDADRTRDDDTAAGDRVRVRTDIDPLREPFAALGELADAHWLGYDIDETGQRLTVPGPEARIRVVGLARPVRGVVELMRSAHPDERFAASALPADVPDPLAPHLPTRSGWQASTAYDARVLAPAPGKPPGDERVKGRFLLHPERDLVWFDTLFLMT